MVKRLLRSKLMSGISLVTGLVVSFIIIFLIIYHTDFFARRTSTMLSRYLFNGTDFSLRIERVSGNPVTDITLHGIHVRYNGPDYSYDVVRIDRLRCEYSLGSVFRGRPVLDAVLLEKPHVWIKPDSSGVNIIPSYGGGGDGGGQGFEVRSLEVNGGQFIIQGRGAADAVRDLHVNGMVVSDGSGVTVQIESGSFEDIRRDLMIRGLKGRLSWTGREGGERKASGRIELSDLFVELEESTMMINGSVVPDSMSVDLNVAAEPFDVEEITRALGLKTEQFGELQGALSIRGVPGDLYIRGMVNGIFSGYALESFRLQARWDSPVLDLERGWGRFNGADVDGSGTLTTGDGTSVSADVEVRGLDLSAGFFRNTRMIGTDLSGRLKLDYGPTVEGLSFGMEMEKGSIREFPFDTGEVIGRYSGGEVRFERLAAFSPTHSIESHGDISTDGSLKLYIEMQCAAADTFFGYFGIEDYRAGLNMNGIWEGTFSDWDIRTNGSFTGLDYLGLEVPYGSANLILRNSERFSLQMEMKGDSCIIASRPFESIELSLGYADGTTTIRNLTLGSADLDLDTRGEIRRTDEGVEAVIGSGTMEMLGEQWIVGGLPRIDVAGRRIEVEDLQLHSRTGALYLNGSIDRDERLVDAKLDFERLDLEVLNRAGVKRPVMSGRARGQVGLSGRLDDPSIDIDVDATETRIDTFNLDSVSILAEYADGTLDIDTLTVLSPDGDLFLAGKVDSVRPFQVYRDGAQLLKAGTVDLSIECDSLETGPLLGLLEKSYIGGGRYSGKISVRESIVSPIIGMDGKVYSLSTDHFTIPETEVHAALGGEVLSVTGKVTLAPGKTGDFRAALPVRDSAWFYSPDYDRPLFIEFELSGGDLSVIPGLTDMVAEARGGYSLRLVVDGTLSQPALNGELGLSGASFRFAGTEERFRDVEARVLLQDSLITVDRLKGSEGRKGSFEVTGKIKLDGWKPDVYDLDINLEKFLIASITDVMAIVSGKLEVANTEVEGVSVPSVTGNLDVNSAEVYFDIGEFSSGAGRGTMEAPSWVAEIELEVKGNAWIKTPDANVEMQGNVTLHKDRRGIYLRGALDLIRGWYMVYNNKFRVTSGRLEFVNAEGFRPIVDIEAETRDPEGKSIYLTLSWHQDDVEPRLTLYHEDPGYSETDIWKMLGGGVVGQDGGGGTSWDALNTAQNLAANYIEKMLNSRMEGITIELETSGGSSSSSGAFEPNETVVAIGKYLSEGLYVQYKQGLSISTARHFEVEYRISRLFQIRSEMIMYSEELIKSGSQRTGDEYNVDLKLRWEF